MKIDLLKIKSTLTPPSGSKDGFDSYIASMERLVKEIVPESMFEIEDPSQFIGAQEYFQKLNETLPIMRISPAHEAPCTLAITLLCSGDCTYGVGRFLCDRIARFLIPGKFLPLTLIRSLDFKFLVHPDYRYSITEIYIEAENSDELRIIEENFPRVSREICLTTLSVEHARKVVLLRGMSIKEKGMLLLENFCSLVNRPHKELHHTIFDEAHHLLLKAMQEKSPDKIPDHLLPMLKENPQVFNATIFNEIQNYLMLFDESFSKIRPLTHLNKLLSYLYLFRKIITHTILTTPLERHTSFKLLSSKLNYKERTVPILAFLIGVNLIKDHEILEEQEVFNAIERDLPGVEIVNESLINKKQGKERVRIIYLEIKHPDERPFTQEEVKLLKNIMPKQIKECIKRTPAPHPSTYSEEETMRNILTLSKELQTPTDPPLVIIQFHNQFKTNLHFSVILARIQKPDVPYLSLPNTAHVLTQKLERKVCGILNKRHLKEAYIFDVHVRGAKSIAEGRQKLLQYLKKNLHELHDFNGGMIIKQYETLAEFKNLLSDPFHDSLIESYFYSITPSYMQSLIPPEVLKEHFSLLLNTLDNDFLYEEGLIVTAIHPPYALFLVFSTDLSLIDRLKELAYTFVQDPSELLSTNLKIFDLHVLGFLIPQEEIQTEFKEHLECAIREHKTSSCFQLI